MLVALSAFVVAFVLFMPFVCSTGASESLGRSYSQTSCATVSGLSLPGFSGGATSHRATRRRSLLVR